MKKKFILVVIIVFAIVVSGAFVLTKCLKKNPNYEQVNVVKEKNDEITTKTGETEDKTANGNNESPKEDIQNQENKSKTSTKVSEKTKKKEIKSNNEPTTSNNLQEEKKENKTAENNKTNSSSNQEQQSKESTTFYDSITHGKKEFSSESEALKRGTEIQNKELDYVLDWNEEHPDNQIQPEINYFRVYPSAIDENGKYWYYLHFFCRSGEGLDQELKSKY